MIGDDPTLPEITAPQPLDPRLAAGPLPDVPARPARHHGGWVTFVGVLLLLPALGRRLHRRPSLQGHQRPPGRRW